MLNSHDFGRGALHFPAFALFPIRESSRAKNLMQIERVMSHARQSVFEEITE
jgi:hypothetical protein